LKVSELSKILEVLGSHAPKDVGVFSIANETGLAPQAIREYLSKYKDYFVQLPNEQSYQVNRFGKFGGCVDVMIQHYKKDQESQKFSSNWWLYLLFISVSVTLVAIIA